MGKLLDCFRGDPFDCPCRDCAERHIGCHGNCEGYLSWRDRIQAQHSAERAYSVAKHIKGDAAVGMIWRHIRQRSKRLNNG